MLVYKKWHMRKRYPLGEYLNNIWQASLDLLFPPPALCTVCGRKLTLGAQLKLCPWCLEQLPLVGTSLCQQCGRPVAGGHGNTLEDCSANLQTAAARQPKALALDEQGPGLCFDCRHVKHFFVRNRAVGIYSGALKEQIQEMKYRYNRQLGIALGQVMALMAKGRGWIPREAHLLAVPLHPQRLQQRGYNQAELLIQGMESLLPAPVLEPGTVVRRQATEASRSLNPRQRRANLRGAFYVPRPGRVADKVLCIVDDIYTTGATLDELARTLLQAGARAVYGLTLSIAVDDYDL
ncbi:MAG: ComF family protein [Firmicutes bacterium]|nr:ComF family protein [Bacillota bacterium]